MGGRVHIYALGQGLGYAVDLAVFFVCTTLLGVKSPVAANVIGKVCSATFAYFYHKNFSFPEKKKNAFAKSFAMFAAVVVGNMVLTSFLLQIFHSTVGLPVTMSKIAADVVGIVATYLALRMLVFSPARTLS